MNRIGRDTVHREGRCVIVQSPREMTDWRASSFRRTEVVYERERFFVAEAGREAGRFFRYVLEPWPPDLHDLPSRRIVYDAEYVGLRDGDRARAWLGLLLWPLQTAASPLLGCLWHRSKRRLESRLGLHPERATRQSLFGEYLLAVLLVLGTWLSLLDASLAPGIPPLALFAGAMLLLADAVMRYDHLQSHPQDLVGVGEWLVRFGRGHR